MANRWDVTPKNGVTNIGNGVFNFSANTTTEDREYTITYYSEACNCTCEKKVIIEAAPCLCTIESSYGEDNPVGSEADESVEVGTITGCFENIQWEHTGGDNFVDNFSVDAETGKITARVSKNTGDAVRHGEYSASCNSTLTVYQAKPGECTITWLNVGTTCNTCACGQNDFVLNATSLSIPNDGYNDIIGTVSDCIDKQNMYVTAATGSLWDNVILERDSNDIYLVVPRNDSAAREITARIGYSATCGTEVWTKDLSLSQDGGNPCTCDGFVFQGEDEGNDIYKYEISAGGTTGTLLAKINEGCKVIDYRPGTQTGDFNDIASAGCGGGLIFDGSTLKINTVMNTTSSEREGTMPVTYKVSGETGITDFCTKTIHLVQAGGGPSQSLTVYLKVTGNMYSTRKSNMATIKVNGISVDLRYTTQQGIFEGVYATVAGDAAADISAILCGTISTNAGEAKLTDESTSSTYIGKVTSNANLHSMANIVINITQS